MEQYKEIDLKTWHRAEIFKLYTEQWKGVAFSVTKKLDVTPLIEYLKRNQLKTVPALLYATTECINLQSSFKIAYLDNRLVEWEELNPVYPILNKNKDITFHTINREKSFSGFYKSYLLDMQENREKTSAIATQFPKNHFIVSIPHFMYFDATAMISRQSHYYFTPFVILGKYEEREGRLEIPVAFCGNHAVTDAWHINIFFEALQKMFLEPELWCKN